MPPTYKDLGIPDSKATVDVKVFDIKTPVVKILAEHFMSPILPGRELFTGAMFTFLIEHEGKKLMFDLGPRKDAENAPPVFSEAVKSGNVVFTVEKDVVERLKEARIPLDSIDTVIWSHIHFDHVGDMSLWPTSVPLVVGQGTDLSTYPENPSSGLHENYLRDRKVIVLNFDESTLNIGGFRAIDYFEDGSFYLLDAPGHISGHIVALARVTPSSFILLGGDSCHHPGQLRPTAHLHATFPCPGTILAQARKSFSAEHFASNGSTEVDLSTRTKPLLEIAEGGYYQDPPTARESANKLTKFDANPDVFLLLAHDGSIDDVIQEYPASLSQWKEKGWKERATWAFVDESNPVFRFN